MTEFPLLDLSFTNLQKVMNKLEGRSYLRMQQTCHEVNHFIRSNRHIRVHFDDEKMISKFVKLSRIIVLLGHNCPTMNAFYGVRLETMITPDFEGNQSFYDSQGRLNKSMYTLEAFSKFRDNLETYRICCKNLIINRPWFRNYAWPSAEQIGVLLALLKPVSVTLDSTKANKFETLFQANPKITKHVEVTLEETGAFQAIPRYLSLFQKVKINLNAEEEDSGTLELVHKNLEILFAKPYPKLHEFSFKRDYTWPRSQPLKEEIEEHLRNYYPVVEQDKKRNLIATVYFPSHFPAGSYCKIIFYPKGAFKHTYSFTGI